MDFMKHVELVKILVPCLNAFIGSLKQIDTHVEISIEMQRPVAANL